MSIRFIRGGAARWHAAVVAIALAWAWVHQPARAADGDAETLLRQRAAQLTPSLDGEAFDKSFVAVSDGTALVEYVRTREDFDR